MMKIERVKGGGFGGSIVGGAKKQLGKVVYNSIRL